MSQYNKPGDYIGRVTANDIDQNLNAEVEYDGTSATGSQYYKVMKNGAIYPVSYTHLTLPTICSV